MNSRKEIVMKMMMIVLRICIYRISLHVEKMQKGWLFCYRVKAIDQTPLQVLSDHCFRQILFLALLPV